MIALALGCGGDLDGGPARPRDSIGLRFEPAPAVFPRLTGPQYRASLEALFGADLPPTPVERDTNPYLFYTIGATSTSLSEVGAQQYEENAHRVASFALADPARRDALVGCTPSEPGDACTRSFVARIGRSLFRRPLEDVELERWTAVARELAEGDAWQGIRFALAGLLQSPSFLYRVELGAPDPESPGRLRYDGYEIASRLAFLLWNAAPDAALLDAAERGALRTEAGVYEQATRLLEDPRARRATAQFFAQYLDLGRLDGLDRDPALYPFATPTLARSLRTEIELLVDDVVFRRDADFREIFRTRRTFVNAELAALYEVEAEGATPITFVPVELPESGPRAGILTLGAFLAMNAHPTETSPTLRGKYVRERVLCELVAPPPDDVELVIATDPTMPRTLRERLEIHRTNPACAACHASIDPPGFLFEGFDSSGAARATDHGYPVDTSGELDGTPLRDGRDLGEVLARDPRVSSCVVRQLWRHANGRLETDGEEAALIALDHAFSRSGYRFRELLLELATSDHFHSAAPPDPDGEEATP
ncbi:MAG: DUF1592 domain-containing protein [Myxococcota bacterium]|nr:DUF1592 domain-containing protein [Myxococcota bacterium]